jgi:hypothetical protein
LGYCWAWTLWACPPTWTPGKAWAMAKAWAWKGCPGGVAHCGASGSTKYGEGWLWGWDAKAGAAGRDAACCGVKFGAEGLLNDCGGYEGVGGRAMAWPPKYCWGIAPRFGWPMEVGPAAPLALGLGLGAGCPCCWWNLGWSV